MSGAHVWAPVTGAPLQLPDRTALRFRYAEHGARYFTRLSAAEAIAHFTSHEPSDGPADVQPENGYTAITMYVDGIRYDIVVIPLPDGGTDLQIDAVTSEAR